MDKNISKESSSFFRVVAGYHNKLIGEKDLLLGDLQTMAEMPSGAGSKKIISLLKELSTVEVQLDTIRKHFAQGDAEDEGQKSK